jgi:demethoxyubiquinone hydroxylase (CLK1/Coq7/Cat5 family)
MLEDLSLAARPSLCTYLLAENSFAMSTDTSCLAKKAGVIRNV